MYTQSFYQNQFFQATFSGNFNIKTFFNIPKWRHETKSQILKYIEATLVEGGKRP